MSNKIDIEVKLEENLEKTKIVIYAKQMDEEVSSLLKRLQEPKEETLIGFKEEQAYILSFKEIESIYTEERKIIAKTKNETYILKRRIFELEEILSNYNFVRISNSEIVNFKKVESLDFKITGTMMIKLSSGYITYASRRYIQKVKEYLGL